MEYEYYIVDVFTDTQFGGNQLAVVPDAVGLAAAQMQQIAAEFGYSESTFVLPPEDGSSLRRVRIFTPDYEMPFAGHPNVGTGFVLAELGVIAGSDGPTDVVFEELAGPVPITVTFSAGRATRVSLRAPRPLAVGLEVDVEPCAAMLGLPAGALVTTRHAPCIASVGAAFLFVELDSAAALAAIAADADRLNALVEGSDAHGVFAYTRDAQLDGMDFRARMLAPSWVGEDAATGSANAALAGLLAARLPEPDGEFGWTVAQGVEMGRPSRIELTAWKQAGRVADVQVAGACARFARGTLSVAEPARRPG